MHTVTELSNGSNRAKTTVMEYSIVPALQQCPAYRFPHRFGGGRCTGFHVVAKQWYTFFGSGDCENCTSHSDGSCQVVDGRESEKEGPVFQELVDFEEIRLLGPYWKRNRE